MSDRDVLKVLCAIMSIATGKRIIAADDPPRDAPSAKMCARLNVSQWSFEVSHFEHISFEQKRRKRQATAQNKQFRLG